MKATGIVSTIDEVGRLVLPKKIRNQLDLKQVEIFIDGDSIVLKNIILHVYFAEAQTQLLSITEKRCAPTA